VRYLWVDKDNNAWWEAVAHYGIDGLFFDPRDPRVTKTYLENQHGKAVGIYFGAAWGELGNTPESYVAKAKQWTDPLRKSNSFPKVQWDLEMHDPEFIIRVLQLWRKAFPWQDTSWTLEGFQGGWMDHEKFVKPLLAARIRVVPQYFQGDMTPWCPDTAMKDLLARGIPHTVISGCYDAGLLLPWWDGFAFSQGRLRPW
jgi:hypothetical protein